MSFEFFERDGRRFRLAVVRTRQGVWVGWPGGAKHFVPERAEASAGAPAVAEVRAPMTGRVVAVPVVVGQGVGAGEVLVILQAMKMEYRLTAPTGGVVERVLCAPGEMVDLGATLVTMARAPATEPAELSAEASKAPPAVAPPVTTPLPGTARRVAIRAAPGRARPRRRAGR